MLLVCQSYYFPDPAPALAPVWPAEELHLSLLMAVGRVQDCQLVLEVVQERTYSSLAQVP